MCKCVHLSEDLTIIYVHVCAGQCMAYTRKVSGRVERVATECCETCCLRFIVVPSRERGTARRCVVSKVCRSMHAEKKKAFVELIVTASVPYTARQPKGTKDIGSRACVHALPVLYCLRSFLSCRLKKKYNLVCYTAELRR